MAVWSRRKESPDPAEMSRQLRAQALTRSAKELGLAPGPEHPNVFGILFAFARRICSKGVLRCRPLVGGGASL